MSFTMMQRVWEKSNQKGGARLVLLAIADFHNDEKGYAWPSIAALAKKARMSPRNVNHILEKLKADGEALWSRMQEIAAPTALLSPAHTLKPVTP